MEKSGLANTIVGQYRRMMIITRRHLVDYLTHDTVTITNRSIIEVMTREWIQVRIKFNYGVWWRK